MADEQPIIIIRKKKGGHEGHHGGAWKVAYADFVTAMMAFFLLLWLLNVTTDIERKGIADYFAPASVSKSQSGAGGMFGGLSITSPGSQISQYSPIGSANVMPEPSAVKNPKGEEDPEKAMPVMTTDKATGTGTGTDAEGGEGGYGAYPQQKTADGENAEGQEKSGSEGGQDAAAAAEKSAQEAAAKAEEQRFQQAEQALKGAIQQLPDLKDLAQNLMIDQMPEGLRIQIVDQDRYSMFARGSSKPYPQSRQLLQLVGQVIAQLPNKLSISGHTDAVPFRSVRERDNWDLSVERANESRRLLESAGVDASRIANVVGRADRDPLIKNDPEAAQNRRISIVLLRQATVETGASAPSGVTSALPAPTNSPASGVPSSATPAAAPTGGASQTGAPPSAPETNLPPAAGPATNRAVIVPVQPAPPSSAPASPPAAGPTPLTAP